MATFERGHVRRRRARNLDTAASLIGFDFRVSVHSRPLRGPRSLTVARPRQRVGTVGV